MMRISPEFCRRQLDGKAKALQIDEMQTRPLWESGSERDKRRIFFSCVRHSVYKRPSVPSPNDGPWGLRERPKASSAFWGPQLDLLDFLGLML